MTGDASEYGRLLAERDRLIADGADPAELLVPVPPTGPVPTSLNDSIRRARPTAHTPLGDLVAGRIDQAEYRRRMGDLERHAADSLDVEPAPARRRPEPDRSGAVIVWLAAGLGLVLLAIAVAGIVATLAAAPRTTHQPTASAPASDVAGLALASTVPAPSSSAAGSSGAPLVASGSLPDDTPGTSAPR